MTAAITFFAVFGYTQGTFVYDQQSSDESNFGSGGIGIQANQLIGQSFTPTLSSIGFIRLVVYDGVQNNSLGATLFVNVRTNSIGGAILGSTATILLPDGFGRGSNGVVDFFFSSPIPLSPGVSYFFQPVVQSGDTWGVSVYNTFGYSGGNAFVQGIASPGSDLWFREGIIVPEPSAAVLILVGLAMTRYIRRSSK